MEYLLVTLKDAGESLAGSLRDLYDAGRVWLTLVIGVGILAFLLWLFGRFRRGGS
jgi:hypothetical protein